MTSTNLVTKTSSPLINGYAVTSTSGVTPSLGISKVSTAEPLMRTRMLSRDETLRPTAGSKVEMLGSRRSVVNSTPYTHFNTFISEIPTFAENPRKRRAEEASESAMRDIVETLKTQVDAEKAEIIQMEKTW
jgi:hypothetical protein